MSRRSTMKYVKRSAYLALVIIIVGYALFASRDYIRGPHIEITEPADNSTTLTSTVTLKGKAVRVKSVLLNGRSITMDEQGNWSEIILLYPGMNTISFLAEDKFKHQTRKTLHIFSTATSTNLKKPLNNVIPQGASSTSPSATSSKKASTSSNL